MVSNLVMIRDGEGYSSQLGYVGGLVVSETDYGYVGMMKSYEIRSFVEKGDFSELINLSFRMGDEYIVLDNVKINFVDQFGQVYFCVFKPVKI